MDLAEIRKKAKGEKTPSSPDREDARPCSGEDGLPPSIQGTPAVRNEKGLTEQLPVAVDAVDFSEPEGSDPLEKLFAMPPAIDTLGAEGFSGAEHAEPEEVDNGLQWLTFSLGDEEYALDITQINEIIKPRDITDIPRVPGFILGVISLRGIIIPVFDLCRRLNLGTGAVSSQSRVVVCQEGEMTVGLLVDKITQVVRIHDKDIEPPPAVLSGPDRYFVKGVGRYDGRMLVLLQLENVLNPELFDFKKGVPL
jgi:purine-binding chemotaxis protein CheW